MKTIRHNAETVNRMLNLTGKDIAAAYANSGEQTDMNPNLEVAFNDFYVSTRTGTPVVVFTYRVKVLTGDEASETFTAYITVEIDGTMHGSW